MATNGDDFQTATAAVSWFDNNGGLHIRVYGSDGSNITERCSDTGVSGWQTGQFGQPGSHVAATVWTVGGQASIRVYCTNEGVTTEWCTDPGVPWYQGNYSPS